MVRARERGDGAVHEESDDWGGDAVGQVNAHEEGRKEGGPDYGDELVKRVGVEGGPGGGHFEVVVPLVTLRECVSPHTCVNKGGGCLSPHTW